MEKKSKYIDSIFHLPYNPDLVERARQMRKHPTVIEKRLWQECLRSYPYRVYRQRPIADFILDFYCPSLKLVIELDGESHCSNVAEERDARRTKTLESLGLRVLRFTNHEVMTNFHGVCAVLEKIAQRRGEGVV